MHYRELRPSARLEPFVECFWHLQAEFGGSWEPVYPDGCTEIIFNRGEPADELLRGEAVRQARYFAYGPTDALIRVRTSVRSDVVGIRLRPWGAFPLFGVPAARLAGASIELEAIAPALARRLVPVIESELPFSPTVVTLDDCLCRWLDSRGHTAAPEVASVARSLVANGGASLSDISRLSGWSVRTAQRRFKSEIGLSPKRFARVARFLRFMRLTDIERGATIASLALAAGYYDQSHLHRDVLRFTGDTPTAYLRRASTSFDPLYGSDRLARLVVI